MTHTLDYVLSQDDYDIDIYQHTFTLISGGSLNLWDYRDHVILIVNTASLCRLTPQYRELEELYQKYHQHDFIVLGCPCGQFGGQELATNAEVHSFCQLKFNVSFPLTQKLKVNGPKAHPLFKELKIQAKGLLNTQVIKWNFTKFLIAPNATKIERYSPYKSPKQLEKSIQDLLNI
jgi:glutathione peroxidase